MKGVDSMNTALLKSQIVLHEKRIPKLAEYLGISRSAFYRKLAGDTEFTRKEIEMLIKCLSLDTDTAMAIFFEEKVS